MIHFKFIKSNTDDKFQITKLTDDLYRADIVDRNKKYISKTISSIDIGINPTKTIR